MSSQLPAGFVLDQSSGNPGQLPPGFSLDALPDGFSLDNEKPESRGFFGELLAGINRGMFAQNPEQFANTLEFANLSPSAQSYLRELSKRKAEEIGQATVPTMKNVGSIGNAADYIANKAGEGLAQLAPTVMSSIAGGMVGSAIPGAGTLIGAGTGAAASSYVLNAGDVFKAFQEAGVDDSRARELSAIWSVPISAMDTLGFAGMTGTFTKELKKKAVDAAVKAIAKGATLEGATEAFQQTLQEGAVAAETGKIQPGYGERILESGAGGAITGASVRGAGEAAGAFRKPIPEADTPPSPEGDKALKGLGNLNQKTQETLSTLPPGFALDTPADIEIRPESSNVGLKDPAADIDIPAQVQKPDTSLLGQAKVGSGVALLGPQDPGTPVDFKIVEADELIASQLDDFSTNPNYPQELQPRQRGRAASKLQINRIANNLDPRLLDERNIMASDGAPIVGPDRVVDSGNGRVLAIRKAYNENLPTAQGYRNYLKTQYGEVVDQFRNPVLVRERADNADLSARADFNKRANIGKQLSFSPAEQAIIDAESLSDKTLGLLNDADIDAAANRDFIKSFLQDSVTQEEMGSLIDSNGQISQSGIKRAEGAVLAKAFDDSSLISRIIESKNDDIKGIGNALLSSAPAWSAMRRNAPNYDITQNVISAIRLIDKVRRNPEKMTMQDLLAQSDIETGSIPTETIDALRLFYADKDFKKAASKTEVIRRLREYARQAAEAPQDIDLLGQSPPTRQDLLGSVLGKELYSGLSSDSGSPAAINEGAVYEPIANANGERSNSLTSSEDNVSQALSDLFQNSNTLSERIRTMPPSTSDGPASIRDVLSIDSISLSNDSLLQSTPDVKKNVESAKANKDQFAKDLARIARQFDGVDVQGPRVKAIGSINKKLKRYGESTGEGVRDYLGGRLIADSPAKVRNLVREVASNFDIVQLDNKFNDPKNGYRAIHMLVKLPDGHIAELQVHLKEIADILDETHRLYKQANDNKKLSADQRQDLQTEIVNKFAAAYNKIQADYPDTSGTINSFGVPVLQRWYQSYQAFARRGIFNPLSRVVAKRLGALGNLPDMQKYLIKRYETLGSIGKSQELGKQIFDVFRKKSEKTKSQAYEYLTNGNLDPSIIEDPEARAIAVSVRENLDNLGEELVRRGLLDRAIYEENKGAYLPRAYLKHVFDESRRFSGKGRVSEQGYLKARKDIPKDVRKFILGEITDPGYLAAKGITEQVRDLSILNFLDAVSQNSNWALQESIVDWQGQKVSNMWLHNEADRLQKMAANFDGADKDKVLGLANEARRLAEESQDLINRTANNLDLNQYKQLPDSPRYGRLRGAWVEKNIYNDLFGGMEWLTGDGGFLDGVFGQQGWFTKNIMQTWKTLKVPANIPAQARNFISNSVMLNVSGVDLPMVPVRLAEAARDILSDGKYWNIAKDYGVTQSTFSNVELRNIEDMMRRAVTETNPFQSGLNAVRDGFDKVASTYGAIESIFKTAKIIDEMKKGKPAAEAALEAHKWMLDYSLVPKVVRHLRNSIAPFITYYYKSTPLVVEALLTNPIKMMPYLLLPTLAYAMLADNYDMDEDDKEAFAKAMPEYMQGRATVLPLPWKDQNGKFQVMDLSYVLPWGQLISTYDSIASLGQDPVEGTSELTKDFGLFTGPLQSVTMGMVLNKDPFTGKEIYNQADPPGKKISDMGLYLYNLFAPSMANTEYGAFRRLYDSVAGNKDKWGRDPYTTEQSISRLFGINVYPFEVIDGLNRNISLTTMKLKDVEERLRQRLYDRRLTAEQQQELVKDYRDLSQRLMEKDLKPLISAIEKARESDNPEMQKQEKPTEGMTKFDTR